MENALRLGLVRQTYRLKRSLNCGPLAAKLLLGERQQRSGRTLCAHGIKHSSSRISLKQQCDRRPIDWPVFTAVALVHLDSGGSSFSEGSLLTKRGGVIITHWYSLTVAVKFYRGHFIRGYARFAYSGKWVSGSWIMGHYLM